MKWKDPEDNFIRSECGAYSITKTYLTDFSDDDAPMLTKYRCWNHSRHFGGIFDNANDAAKACDVHKEKSDG
jgi:hypothetical protein